jgi:hydroxymethylbilane synthase
MGLPRQHLKIAARQSDLARLQAETVAAALLEKFPELKIELLFRSSLGDQNQRDPLWKMPEKGVFTEDFYSDLVDEKIDLVVHSWKDLPIEPKPLTKIFATMERADQRDLFLFKSNRKEAVKGSQKLKILTSSPRRSYNLETFFKKYYPAEISRCEFQDVRGNIPTRLNKLFLEDADGLILAKAALDRLLASRDPQYQRIQSEIRDHLGKCQWMVLPLTENPSAAAQGALAIEARNDTPWAEMLSQIHDQESFNNVSLERKILGLYGGGCHQKIGISVLQRSFGEVKFLKGFTDRGEVLNSVSLSTQKSFEKAKSRDQIFWQENQSFFKRENMSALEIGDGLSDPFLWITKDAALPEFFSPNEKQVLWTSGLKTWQKLAAKGIWINGTSESLGESEPARIELLNREKIVWTKLTHEEGQENPIMKTLATYRLKPSSAKVELSQKTHFYWSSGSNFDFCYAQSPDMKNAWHFCGPGHTFNHIKTCLGSDEKLRACLNVEDWLGKVL